MRSLEHAIWMRRRPSRPAVKVPFIAVAVLACGVRSFALAGEPELPAVTENDLVTHPSLEVVERYAVAQNPAIRAARQAWEAARQRIPQVRSYDNVEVTYLPDTNNMAQTRAGPQENGVGVAQPIPFPGKLTLRGRVAEEEAEAAREALQAVTQEVQREVRARYAEYYLAARSLEVNSATTTLAREFAAIAEARYRVGTAPQQDAIQAQEELSRLAAERVAFEGELPAAQGALNAVLDRPPRAPLGPAGEIDAMALEVPLDALVEQAGRARPELRAQDHMIEARRRSLTLAKMGFLPDFKIGGQYIQVGGGTSPDFAKDGQDIWMASLGLSVPIWVNRVRAGVSEARARVMSEEFRRRDLTNQVFDQLQRAYERVGVAARVERIYRLTLMPQTEERVESARAGYQTGRVDFLTLIDSLTSLEDVRLKRYRAVRDYQRALADLERAVGEPISWDGAASEEER
jgi:cobalt-zinc-cadmium efflux system outer membrane protein